MKTTQHLKQHWCIRDFKIGSSRDERDQAIDEFCQLTTDWFHRHGMGTTVKWSQEPDPELNPDGAMILFRLETEIKVMDCVLDSLRANFP